MLSTQVRRREALLHPDRWERSILRTKHLLRDLRADAEGASSLLHSRAGWSRTRERIPRPAMLQRSPSLNSSERLRRTPIKRAIDWLAVWAGHPSFPLLHVAWFAAWTGFNVWSARPLRRLSVHISDSGRLAGGHSPLLFVLAAQDRMTREADRRAKLDLQIDMLAEQELTAILRGIGALAKHSGLDLSRCCAGPQELTSDTRVNRLARRLADADKVVSD